MFPRFEEYGDRAAIQYMGMTMTFSELHEQSGRLARALKEKGLGKGDVVAIDMPNIPQYLIAIAGALRAGCATSGLSPLLMPGEMVYQLNDCGAKALVILDMLFDAKYAGVADQTPDVGLVLVAGATDCLPQVTGYPAGNPLEGKEVRAFIDFLQDHPDNPPEVRCGRDDICYVQYTGGTTGPPKGALLTNGNLVANIYQFDHWVKPERGRRSSSRASPCSIRPVCTWQPA